MKKGKSIAIDGPSASGKSTVAKIIAKRLEFIYIDTGAMYRAFTLGVINAGLDPKNEEEANSLIKKLKIRFNRDNLVTLNGVDVSQRIRENDVADNVSYIASYKNIRLSLVEVQRYIARHNNVVMDGRDIGTYVLKDSDVKIYLIADVEERAKRRFLENKEKGYDTSLELCLENIQKRDFIDSHRSFCPLKPAEDSIQVNTTAMTIEEVVTKIISICQEKGIQ
ncbi:MAG TPA: (d)CMP kinase [Candidatus Onthovivens sp.]|nr:(d)CMP kinase [Candidatus Onthovivens sp.]